MKYVSLIVFLIVCFCSVSFGQNKDRKEQITNVDFCDLLKNSAAYEGKTVRITSIYTFGFEFSQLYHPKCYAENSETKFRCSVESKECVQKEFRKTLTAKGLKGYRGKTVKVTIVGTLETQAVYQVQTPDGVFYQRIFRVQNVENAKSILNTGQIFPTLSKKQKAKVRRVIGI